MGIVVKTCSSFYVWNPPLLHVGLKRGFQMFILGCGYVLDRFLVPISAIIETDLHLPQVMLLHVFCH